MAGHLLELMILVIFPTMCDTRSRELGASGDNGRLLNMNKANKIFEELSLLM